MSSFFSFLVIRCTAHVNQADILAALDAPGGLWGAALDVTDPEPLPKGHPLFTHPAVIITPHISGSFEAYFDSGADVLLRQKEELCAGEGLMNVVERILAETACLRQRNVTEIVSSEIGLLLVVTSTGSYMLTYDLQLANPHRR